MPRFAKTSRNFFGNAFNGLITQGLSVLMKNNPLRRAMKLTSRTFPVYLRDD